MKSKIYILPMMPCKKCTLNFKKQHLKKILKNWLFSNHCLCHLVPCISMKLGTFVWWSFVVIKNKSARICFIILEDSVIQNLKIEKQETVALFPCRGRKNLRIYSWYSLSDLKHDQKRFIHILSLRLSFMQRSYPEIFLKHQKAITCDLS